MGLGSVEGLEATGGSGEGTGADAGASELKGFAVGRSTVESWNMGLPSPKLRKESVTVAMIEGEVDWVSSGLRLEGFKSEDMMKCRIRSCTK